MAHCNLGLKVIVTFADGEQFTLRNVNRVLTGEAAESHCGAAAIVFISHIHDDYKVFFVMPVSMDSDPEYYTEEDFIGAWTNLNHDASLEAQAAQIDAEYPFLRDGVW